MKKATCFQLLRHKHQMKTEALWKVEQKNKTKRCTNFSYHDKFIRLLHSFRNFLQVFLTPFLLSLFFQSAPTFTTFEVSSSPLPVLQNGDFSPRKEIKQTFFFSEDRHKDATAIVLRGMKLDEATGANPLLRHEVGQAKNADSF
uniref:Uncharacterized protein n=1 Tax=Rhizophora mucronata TaxID=61149 RepID=A0A2P2JP83_RHIMU